MAAQAFIERNLERLVHLGSVIYALDVCLAQFNVTMPCLGTNYYFLAKGRSFLLGLLASLLQESSRSTDSQQRC